ncbi:sulfurtransferase/chromate resistance protein [Notoacmeibacter sp. MSK16QG-6]|uniref:chromate resistance protein ChrB domain-containing protein n=1 Tax=Notoacmeibacter sp. MSK16QG-6 TaxID=2957982 RepID=UPI0020A0338C|nr:sulfurtransferase/chromate resistance protein [Notoacmeibacter sp. MSK16QG-6]MCP1199773.1 sulfurtransferase/chromate resistance protein [Notoacmeibacter sp. MSK16QG-6]
MAAPYEISPTQLLRLVGTPDMPVTLDLRIDEDFAADPRTVPTARRISFDRVEEIIPSLVGKRVVVYCQKGRKISQGAAAILRASDIPAEVLEGGQFAWRDVGAPMISATKLPQPDRLGRMVWVTRHRPKIDRIACPWLIRRFIAPDALFLFVPPADVELVAERFQGTPFDIEGVRFSHRDKFCSFDTMISEFGLSDPALDHVATIVRAADTNRHELAPEAPGLLAVMLGLSRMYRDDLAQLEAGMAVYDALYRWARDATDEGHDWPASSTPPRGRSKTEGSEA